MVTDTIPQHIDLEERKKLSYLGSCASDTDTTHKHTHTSYFCLVNWYCSSNFSASSWYIHSHSSLAFCLWDTQIIQCGYSCFCCVRWSFSSLGLCSKDMSLSKRISPPTWVLPGSISRYPEICVSHWESSSSSLSPSASYHFASLSVWKWKEPFIIFKNTYVSTSCIKPATSHHRFSPASAYTLQNGGW